MVGEALLLVSHACQTRKMFPNDEANELGIPNAIVSVVPGVKPFNAGVVSFVQEPDVREGRAGMLNVVDTYSAIGVPPPNVVAPATLRVPLVLQFPATL